VLVSLIILSGFIILRASPHKLFSI
jgi:hypothetical protein